jgi:hypothetical protein
VARRGKKNADEALALALATGLTVPDAAARALVSFRTAYRRLEDPAFCRRVDALRAEIVGRAVGKLAALGDSAAEALDALLKSVSETVKLGAVRTCFEYIFKGNEVDTLRRQLQDLRTELEVLKHGPGFDASGSGAASPRASGTNGHGPQLSTAREPPANH